jgi:hypothetical protein
VGFDISIHLIVLGNIERNRVGTDEKTAMIVLGRAGGEVLVRVPKVISGTLGKG